MYIETVVVFAHIFLLNHSLEVFVKLDFPQPETFPCFYKKEQNQNFTLVPLFLINITIKVFL